MRVRFRVDGVLDEAARVPRRMVAGVVSRIKIMSELDIAEKRVPQDGRVGVNVDGREVDLRVVDPADQRGEGRRSESSTRAGDAHPRRARPRRQRARPLRRLDPASPRRRPRHRADRLGQVDDAVRRAAGAERGRRRTSSRSRTRSSTRSTGINQMGVNRKAGPDFAAGLRSILRADPDMIMVGEIRDAETARIAIESALTGHMVLSTLHTNDAPSADHPASEDGHRELPDRLGRRLRDRPAARADSSAPTARSARSSSAASSRRPASGSAPTSRPGTRSAAAAAPAPATAAASASSR